LSDHFGSAIAFLGLAVVAIIGFFVLWGLMPETRPTSEPHRNETGLAPSN
jgi:predicted MFS family arabinose efflux permease